MKEKWRAVVQDSRYDVSNLGNVRSWSARGRYAKTARAKQGKPCRVWIHRQGYHLVVIGSKREYVHKLVAEAFIGPRPKGKEVRHLDDNKDRNLVSNLRYGTRSQNTADAWKNTRGKNVVS